MATGLPVVVTDTGGARELVDRNGLVVSWGSVPELTEVLAKMAASPAERESMGHRSREIALGFTWEMVAARYWDLCDRVVPQAESGL
jgi:glycosyltransferase involved in cell wall biosynthesis